MAKLLIPLGILLFLVVVVRVVEIYFRKRKPVFQYSRKDCVMTDAERECFTALVAELGTNYHFFPQVHLDSIVVPKSNGRNRLFAFRHINQKSVDFVACDKRTLRPLIAIEVDDKTHNQPKRIERDREVERILADAGIPLVRIENRGRFDPKQLAQQIQKTIERNIAKPSSVYVS
jgi:very-short-patch-repair endonuclease